MNIYVLLIICSIATMLCATINRITAKMGMPLLLAFIFLGMLFGSDGIFAIPFDNFKFAEHICATALVFIMFYGGYGAKWKAIKPAMSKALLLSSLGTVLTAFSVAAFCYFLLGINFAEGMLIGSVLSSTDAASVFSILKTKKLSLKYNTDAVLEVESGSNDPFSYMLTLITISVIKSGEINILSIVLSVCQQIFFGVLFGVLIAWAAKKVIEHMHFAVEGFDAVFIMSAVLLSYALPSLLNGSGFLSAYIVGIILGNAEMKNKKNMVHFFDGISGLAQIVIFFLLGLLAFPSRMISIIPYALSIAAFLTFVARPLVVTALMKWFGMSFRQIFLISWAGLRGASSIVFVIIAYTSLPTENDIFHIVFFAVMLSIAFQGTLLPFVAKKLDMISDDENVLKTFNDYTDDIDIDFIRLKINVDNPWANSEVKNLELPPGCLLVLIKREDKNIIPDGSTVVKENDIVILSALSYIDEDDIKLKEITIDKEHKWKNKKIAELDFKENSLIIMVRRDDNVIVPNGSTLIAENDTLVIGYI